MTAQAFAVLRRGEMDERDAAICAAVWRAWSASRGISLRELAREVGMKSATAVREWRLRGEAHGVKRHDGGLFERGWLTRSDRRFRILRPGPRFAGLDHGHPLERVEGMSR